MLGSDKICLLLRRMVIAVFLLLILSMMRELHYIDMELKICCCNVVLQGSFRKVLFFKCDYSLVSLMNLIYAEIFIFFLIIPYSLNCKLVHLVFLLSAQLYCRAFWDNLCRYSVLCCFHFIINI